MCICSGDKHLVRGVVYSGEEGDRLGGWSCDSLPIYISLRALLSFNNHRSRKNTSILLYTLLKSFSLPIILRVSN
jgi:hypothetical protein